MSRIGPIVRLHLSCAACSCETYDDLAGTHACAAPTVLATHGGPRAIGADGDPFATPTFCPVRGRAIADAVESAAGGSS
jgi:hypothetical protein